MDVVERENELVEWSTVCPLQCFYRTWLGSSGKQQTSGLEAPIMLLKGHQSAIYTMKCNPAGTVIARFWRVYGDCKNFMVLKGDKGHKNAILDSIVSGADACLAEDTFFIDYNLRTNLLGTIFYGETHCLDLPFRVSWAVRELVASFYTCKPRNLSVPDYLRSLLWEGKVTTDLAKFAEMTGLDTWDHVRVRS